jgi:hypothetical protein
MAKLISERVWHSKKVRNIQPPEWSAEYTWLLPIAFVDGTFEADAQDIWSRAYACIRQGWDADKVAKLLDEFERVGLLQRTTDTDGKVWGFWVGSDNFLPPPSHRERYKAGKRSLFGESSSHQGGIKDASSSHQGCIKDASLSPPERVPLGVGSGVGGGFGRGEGTGVGLVCGQGSENEQPQEQVKGACSSSSSSPTATPTAAATPTPTPLPFKRIRTATPAQDGPSDLDPNTARAVAEFAAELAARGKK